MDRWSLPFILIRFVGLFTLFRWSQKKTIFVVVIFFLFSLLRVAVFCYLIFWRGMWQNIIHLLQHQPKHTQKGSAKNYRTNNEERAHRLAISLLLVAISYVKRDNTYIYRYLVQVCTRWKTIFERAKAHVLFRPFFVLE